VPRRPGHPQARPAELRRLPEARRLPGPVHLVVYERQDGAGCIEQHGAGLGQLQAFPATLQQLRADDLLESPDLLAQARPGDEHLLRGVGESACVGERHEVTQTPQLNCQRDPATSVGGVTGACPCFMSVYLCSEW
jgi:hypothetical protein